MRLFCLFDIIPGMPGTAVQIQNTPLPVTINVKKPTVDPDITSLRRFHQNLLAISGFPFHGISLHKSAWSSKIRAYHLCAQRGISDALI